MTSIIVIDIMGVCQVLCFGMLHGAPDDVVRCTWKDEFLMRIVSNSYQQHSVWMKELEVGQSQPP